MKTAYITGVISDEILYFDNFGAVGAEQARGRGGGNDGGQFQHFKTA